MERYAERSAKADHIDRVIRAKIPFLRSGKNIKFCWFDSSAELINTIDFRFSFKKEDDVNGMVTEDFIKEILSKMNLELSLLEIKQVKGFEPVLISINFRIKY